MESLQDILLSEFSSEAERSFSLGDAYDMKANVLLVVIVFLATQTAYFLSIPMSPIVRLAQEASAASIVVAGVLTLIELLPRDYIFFSPSNGAVEKKIEHLRREHHGAADHVISAHLAAAEIEWARERAATHKKINKFKSKILIWVFGFMVGSVGLNLLTLLCVAMHPSSSAH